MAGADGWSGYRPPARGASGAFPAAAAPAPTTVHTPMFLFAGRGVTFATCDLSVGPHVRSSMQFAASEV